MYEHRIGAAGARSGDRPLRLLLISPLTLAPASDGGRRRTLSIATALAARSDCALATLSQATALDADVPFPTYAGIPRSRAARLLSPSAILAIRRAAKSWRPDAVVLELPYLALNVRVALPRAVLHYDAHNVERFRHRTAGRAQRALVAAAERIACAPPTTVSVVSAEERDRLVGYGVDKARIGVAPNAVEPSTVAPVAGPRTPVFFGRLDYAPNIEALRALRADFDGFVERHGLLVFGAGTAPPDVDGWLRGHCRIEYLGEVPDPRAVLARASVLVAPLRTGGGTRLKILEAVAEGLPVVTFPEAAEGIDPALCAGLLRVGSNSDELTRLAELAIVSGRGVGPGSAFFAHYSWDAAAAVIVDLVRAAVAARAPASS